MPPETRGQLTAALLQPGVLRHPTPNLDVSDSSPDNRTTAIQTIDSLEVDDYLDNTRPILRAFLNHLPAAGARVLATEIVHHAGDLDKLKKLKQFLIHGVIWPLSSRNNNKTLPESPGDPVIEVTAISDVIQPALKAKCLRRDNHRCLIDRKLVEGTSVEAELTTIDEASDEYYDYTECCHILPYNPRKCVVESDDERHMIATIWWALHRYFPALKGKICAETINQPDNLLTLQAGLHKHFDLFNFALEPTQTPHGYNCVPYKRLALTATSVTFRSYDQKIPLPDADFLQAHACVARVLDISDLRKINFRDHDNEPQHLCPNGSTDITGLLRGLL
ncbi:hypothetical protein GE09DRAFT_382591 [Coniochaeta sp. 2T2.1]|nr:hypothetical protein GE09DRAFT_382591 [Coniochaeta sp. 2T2.1]